MLAFRGVSDPTMGGQAELLRTAFRQARATLASRGVSSVGMV